MSFCKKPKHCVLFLTKLAVTTFLCVWLFRSVDVSELLFQFSQIQAWLVVLAVLLWLASVFFSTVRWWCVCIFLGLHIPLSTLFHTYLAGSFIGNFLPSSVGGDAFRSLYLVVEKPSQKTQVISSILLERGIGLIITICTAVVFGMLTLPELLLHLSSNYLSIFLAIVLVACIAFITLAYLYRRYQTKIPQLVDIVVQGRKNYLYLFYASIFSVFHFVLAILYTWIFFRSLFVSISPIALAFIVPSIQLAVTLPISINGLGVKENVGVYLYGLFGVPASTALTVLVSFRIIFILASSIGAFSYLYLESHKVSHAKK